MNTKSYISLFFVFFLFFMATQNLYAQKYTPSQDSLIQVLKTEQNKNQRLDTYFELVDNLYFDGKEKEGDFFYKKMETFIKKENPKSGAGYLSILKSYKTFFIKNDISNAIIYGIEGTEALKMSGDTSFSMRKNLIIAIDELGYFYENAGMYDKALSAYLESLDLSKQYKYKYGEMVANNRLFFLHSEYFNDDEIGIEYLKKSLKIAEEIQDMEYIGIVKGNLAMLYIKMGYFQKADFFLEKATAMKAELKDTVGLAHSYLEKARLYFKTNDFKSARLYIEKCLDFVPEKCDWCYQIQVTKGQIAKAEGNYNEAEKAFLLAEELTNLAPNLSGKYRVFIHLARLAKDRNETKKAGEYYAKALETKEELDNQWTLGNAMKIKIQSKVEKIETEKKNLIAEKELLGVKFKLQQRIGFLVILLLCLAIGSAGFIFFQKKKLLNAYHILVQKNQALTISVLKKEAKKETDGIKIILENENHAEETNDEKTISVELEAIILKKIEEALEVDKVFLDNTLSLVNFAQLLDTNTSYLSKTINNHYNKRFSTLINEYRIKEILQYFESDRLKDFTIFALAQEAGFNSKSAFNKAFKEFVGVTPTFYLKSIEKSRESKLKYNN